MLVALARGPAAQPESAASRVEAGERGTWAVDLRRAVGHWFHFRLEMEGRLNWEKKGTWWQVHSHGS